MIEAVLFDFFGTLVDYSPSRVEQGYPRTHALLAEHGVALAYDEFLTAWVAVSEELDDWSRRLSREFSMEMVGARFLSRIGAPVNDSVLARALGDMYVEEWGRSVRYLPGIVPFIAELTADYRLGIVTNTHHAGLVPSHLERMGIAASFRSLVTSVELGHPKPHPAIFEAALRGVGSAPHRTLFVGDSYAADYLGAKRTGMHAALIDPGASSPVPAAESMRSLFDLRAHLDARSLA